MARTTLRALVFLACVVAFGCSGDSNPTNPDNPPSGGGGGGTAGGGGGGGGGTGATAIASDDVFDDNNWDAEVQTLGNGGSGGASHVRYNGQEGADYRRVNITANSAEGSGAATQVAVFSIKRGTAYFPSSDGAIIAISYSEDSILFSGGGNGQYSAPALRQNGKLYTLVPGGGAFATPEPVWTPHSLSNLRQNDFRTLASGSDHPDFSSTGTRIEVGFMRLHTVPAGSPGGTRLGGIDNWRLTFHR
ncbi:MAG TPA: hypothetical protein VFB92_06220 [Vicinamibacterales bacterium]|nr:hypothetical protein [Vicinamibacterales bacterium]